MQTSLNRLIESSVRNHWSHAAISDFNGETLSYADVARRIAKLHIIFELAGLKPGDRVTLCGKNSANWATAFLAVIGYGAVAVPLLHDFHADTLQHLVIHSNSRLIFTDSKVLNAIDGKNITTLEGAISLDDFSILFSSKHLNLEKPEKKLNMLFGEKYPDRFGPDQFSLNADNEEDVCVINYTSGSTGFSKGVMLPRRSLVSNLTFAVENIKYLYPDDGMVSMLPLAHMFGLSIEFLFPLLKGCHITFLGKTPAPTVILKAFATIRPKLIIAVPLILEKVVKNKVFPVVNSSKIKLLLKIPLVKKRIYAKIRQGLMDAFGGNLIQLIVGGAPLNKDVEKLLMKINFPVTVGYGMTECGPLIAYAPWQDRPAGSCGKVVDGLEMKIDSPDPEHKAGELWVKGKNVMKGYYNAPDITESIFKDGWMNTGDLCMLDRNGFLYIRGRNKTMILGPSGQNIYPEEIESRINNLPLVTESLVVERDGRLVALVVVDADEVKKLKLSPEKIKEQLDNDFKSINNSSAAYERIASYEIMEKEFEKTPKRSIKRFLYS